MAGRIPNPYFLYIWESGIDLGLKTLRERITTIPGGLIQVEYGCYAVVSDFVNSGEIKGCDITLGYRFHPSIFEEDKMQCPHQGLLFHLNPPWVSNNVIQNIRMNHATSHEFAVKSSFMIGGNRFILTSQEFDLDKTICGDLRTGEIYKKPLSSKKFLQNAAKSWD